MLQMKSAFAQLPARGNCKAHNVFAGLSGAWERIGVQYCAGRAGRQENRGLILGREITHHWETN